MKPLKESPRVKKIEQRWGDPIESLLYKWHWGRDQTHKEIAIKIDVPRSTITRWFKKLQIPTQDSHRITKLYLLNVGPIKGPRAKPKQKSKAEKRLPVNQKFFKKWTPEMAYVLGFFTADGYMFINPRGSRYIAFTSTDRKILEKIRAMMDSKHAIGEFPRKNPKWKTKYSLQIGSKKMFKDILDLGLTPNKQRQLRLPNIPKSCFNHFTRGYFDGDGCVYFGIHPRTNRRSKQFLLRTIFTSIHKNFLNTLFGNLEKYAMIKGGFIAKKSRGGFDLNFSAYDSKKLYKFMYNGVSRKYFLERKYDKFNQAFICWKNHLNR